MYGNYEDGPQMGHYPQVPPQRMVFDGKRMRKPIQRKTVDFNSVVINHLETRQILRPKLDLPGLEPSPEFIKDYQLPSFWPPISSVCTKFIHTSTNKIRCPINVVRWTPEGRRLITGSSSGEFTLWNGLTFNFETILQAHDTAVRAMIWSHNNNWMVTGDHGGIIKYWQPNMNNVKAFTAHKEAIRDLGFSPTDIKFVSCSDDVTLKIWDFALCKEEHVLTGHGADIKCVSWHPQKSLLVSGGKDNLIKIWDAKSGKNITTLHGHKNTVLQVKWNLNGNWLLTASRDQLLKLFDIRTMKEVQTFKGHKKEVTAVAWHPFHEDLFVSGGFDGSILYWLVGSDESVGDIQAHESSVWDLDWHPVGHILCSGSNDHTTKFWCRNRPADKEKDKYIINKGETAESTSTEPTDSLPAGSTNLPSSSIIPGVGGKNDYDQQPDHLPPPPPQKKPIVNLTPQLNNNRPPPPRDLTPGINF